MYKKNIINKAITIDIRKAKKKKKKPKGKRNKLKNNKNINQ